MSNEQQRGASLQWRRILAEGMAIVVSILLAFGIQAWWDDQQDRAEEQELLTALRQEFVENEASLATSVARIEGAQDNLRRLVAMSPSDWPTLPREQVGRVIVTPVRRFFTFELTVGSLNSAVSSGKLALIRNAEIRAGLAQFQAHAGNAEELGSVVAALGVEATRSLSRHPQFAAILLLDPDEAGLDSGAAALSDSALMALGEDPEFRAVVASKAYYWDQYRATLSTLAASVHRLRELIEAQLASYGRLAL